MNEVLPSLAALKVFTSCARHRSFARASEELGVSPAAVTHHIRAIEAWAGVPLFRRTGRAVHLTDEAEAALPLLTEGFLRIAQGTDLLRTREATINIVTVAAPPTFAAKWLLARLDSFRAAHPEIDVWVSVDSAGPRPGKAPADIYIRYGLEPGEGVVGDPLVRDEVVPIAAPQFIDQHGIVAPRELAKAPLLHYISDKIDPSFPDWPGWFLSHGVANVAEATRGPRFDHPGILIDQAVAGQGAALAKRILALPDILAGRLVALFEDSTPVRSAYWLTRPRGRTLRQPVKRFIDWIRADIAMCAVHN